jgi:pimeloyl-ACP methyl ester carboxylesterase
MDWVLIAGLVLAGAALLLVAGVLSWFALATRRIAANAERLVPPSGSFVTVGENRIHYVEKGEGPPILFIHGLGGQLHHFRHPLFDAFGPGYRLIAIDRPGSGYSVRAPRASARLPEQAAVIARFIEMLGLQRPLLVGHSLGGAVALATALDHPQLVSGIVLLAPLTHVEEAIRPEFKGLYIKSRLKRWLLAHTFAVPRSLKFAPRTLAFVFGPQPWPADYAVEGGGLAGLRPSHIYATASDIVAIEHDLERLQNRYGEIRIPAGILFGVADRVLDYRLHGLPMRDKIEGIEVEILDGIGHMPHYAATGQVVAFIRLIARRAFAARRDGEALAYARPQNDR